MAKKLRQAKGTFTILNEKGLHTRPSTELVKCAARFDAQIFLSCHNYIVNAKSLLGILMLAAKKGTKIRIDAKGEDAKEAVRALLKLAENRFKMSF